jgi:hypothetical protein
MSTIKTAIFPNLLCKSIFLPLLFLNLHKLVHLFNKNLSIPLEYNFLTFIFIHLLIFFLAILGFELRVSFTLARQALYLFRALIPLCLSYFSDRVSCFVWDWLGSDPPIFIFHEIRNIGMCHHT